MARVFVSHSSKDAALADEVHRWLVDDGHEAFVDQDLSDGILAGEEWERRLHERLRWADAVVCVLTSAYLASMWCTAEVAIAQSRGSRLLPVRAEPEVRHPLLDSVQYADMAGDAAAARAMVAEALLRVDASGGFGWPDDRSPFPGLRPLDTDEHLVFFGRNREIDQLATLLRSPAERAEPALVLVVGPSGSGKSSLARAGLLPVMAAEPDWWTLPAILPGTQPVAALARELAVAARHLGLSWTATDVRRRLDDDGLVGLVDDLLLALPGRRRRHLLVVVDQFEELLTQTSREERARFAELMRRALAGPVQVVATLRPEFLDQMLADPELAALPTRTQALRPLQPEALRTVIEGPADRAGIGIDEDLVTRLVTDTGGGEALPLLAYTLAQLTHDVDRGGRLSTARYEQLGGVQGALAGQADAALTDSIATGGRSPDQVVRELLRLVTVDEQGRPTRWRIRRDELSAQVLTELQPFVDRRLLTTDTESSAVVLGVAHEAFLTAWPPLEKAITASATALRARREIEQAAAEWAELGHAPTRLWERGQLAAALSDTGARLRPIRVAGTTTRAEETSATNGRSPFRPGRHRTVVADRVELSARAQDFLRASIGRDRRRRGGAMTVLSTLLVLALVAGAVGVAQRNRAVAQSRISLAGQLATLSGASTTEVDLAQLLAVQAFRTHPDPQTRAALFRTATASGHLVRYLPFGGHVADLATSGDGTTVVAGLDDGRVLRWRLPDAAPVLLFTLPAPVVRVSVDDDGSVVAGAGGQQAMLSTPGRAPVPLGVDSGSGGPEEVAVSPSGRTVVAAVAPLGGGSNTIVTLDSETGTVRRTGPGVSDGQERVGVLKVPSDQILAMLSEGGRWERRNIDDLSLLAAGGPGFGVHSMASDLSADGSSLTSTNGSSTVPVWRTVGDNDFYRPAATGRASLRLPDAIALDRTGSRVAVADSGVVYVSAAVPDGSPAPIPVALAGGGSINRRALEFLGDGTSLASATGNGVVIWDLAQTDRLTHVGRIPIDNSCNACGPPSAALSPDRTLATVLDGDGYRLVIARLEGSVPYDDVPIQGTAGPPVWGSDSRSVGIPIDVGDTFTGDLAQPLELANGIHGWPVPYGWQPLASGPAADGHEVVIVGRSESVERRDRATGVLIRRVRDAGESVAESASVSPSGNLAAVANREGMTVFDTQRGEVVSSRQGGPEIYGIAYGAGVLMVQRATGELEMWDERGQSIIRTLPGDASYRSPPVGSPRSSIIARGRTDSSIVLMDAETGTAVAELPPPVDTPGLRTGSTFSPDGTRFVTVTETGAPDQLGTITWRDISDEALIATACRTAGRDLTTAEWQSVVQAKPPDDLRCR